MFLYRETTFYIIKFIDNPYFFLKLLLNLIGEFKWEKLTHLILSQIKKKFNKYVAEFVKKINITKFQKMLLS